MSEDWSQPDFYHFNQDSLAFVNWIVDQKLTPDSILDFGCGCGIIGIELARRLLPNKLALVDLQSEFLPHLEFNIKAYLPSDVEVQHQIISFHAFRCTEKFDLIVSNPPFYLPEHGHPSGNLNRARCRSFIVDGWEIFLNTAKSHLQSSGKILLIIPDDRVLRDHVRVITEKINLKLKTNVLGKMLILELTAA